MEPGTYRHYKGGLYEVLGVARHSETEELMVVYRALYGGRGLWVRPRAMFEESVLVDGREVPRFAPVAELRGSGPRPNETACRPDPRVKTAERPDPREIS